MRYFSLNFFNHFTVTNQQCPVSLIFWGLAGVGWEVWLIYVHSVGTLQDYHSVVNSTFSNVRRHYNMFVKFSNLWLIKLQVKWATVLNRKLNTAILLWDCKLSAGAGGGRRWPAFTKRGASSNPKVIYKLSSLSWLANHRKRSPMSRGKSHLFKHLKISMFVFCWQATSWLCELWLCIICSEAKSRSSATILL